MSEECWRLELTVNVTLETAAASVHVKIHKQRHWGLRVFEEILRQELHLHSKAQNPLSHSSVAVQLQEKDVKLGPGSKLSPPFRKAAKEKVKRKKE